MPFKVLPHAFGFCSLSQTFVSFLFLFFFLFSSTLLLDFRLPLIFVFSDGLNNFLCRFETVYLDDEIRVVKDIRQDYLVVERAPYTWKE